MEKREKILQDYIPALLYGYKNDMGGVKHFTGVPLSKLQELRKAGLIESSERQNESPTVAEFMGILRHHPTLTVHGYIVTESRDDARTSIEGVEGVLTAEEIAELVPVLGKADDYDCIPDEKHGTHYKVRAWWD